MRPAIRNATRALAVAVIAAALAGCAGLPAPKTPKQTLAYAEASYTAAVRRLADQRQAGALSAAQIDAAGALIARGNQALGSAHAALAAGDTRTLQGRLAALDAVRVQIRAILRQGAEHG